MPGRDAGQDVEVAVLLPQTLRWSGRRRLGLLDLTVGAFSRRLFESLLDTRSQLCTNRSLKVET